MNGQGSMDWEMRPGGMLVQRRSSSSSSSSNSSSSSSPFSGPLLHLKVSHGLEQHNILIPSEATFGDLKWILAPLTNLRPKKQSLLFRGKEREDSIPLHVAGVVENSMITLLDPASKERKIQNENEVKQPPSILAYKKDKQTSTSKQVRRVRFVDNSKIHSNNPFQENNVTLNVLNGSQEKDVAVGGPASSLDRTIDWEVFD